ncbi:uncharacterized protein PG986_000108 [Apiospora aurea]|uniref:Uncharacterized protein n=1 Tax=Apiospora aurea TaxID=335848 RepID=A0ABR1QT26_9PEZI
MELYEGRTLNPVFRPNIFTKKEGIVVDGTGKGGVSGRGGGPGGSFEVALEQAGDDPKADQARVSSGKQVKQEDAHSTKPPSRGKASETHTVCAAPPSPSSQP